MQVRIFFVKYYDFEIFVTNTIISIYLIVFMNFNVHTRIAHCTYGREYLTFLKVGLHACTELNVLL